MKKIAVIGSREGVNAQDVALKVNELFNEHGAYILVSGGGEPGSVNFVAEQTALGFGLAVISFRPTRLADYHSIDPQFAAIEWRLHRGSGTTIQHEPTWADWTSAANFRSMLIAERAEEAVAFHHDKSRGTAFEIELFGKADKAVEVIES